MLQIQSRPMSRRSQCCQLSPRLDLRILQRQVDVGFIEILGRSSSAQAKDYRNSASMLENEQHLRQIYIFLCKWSRLKAWRLGETRILQEMVAFYWNYRCRLYTRETQIKKLTTTQITWTRQIISPGIRTSHFVLQISSIALHARLSP